MGVPESSSFIEIMIIPGLLYGGNKLYQTIKEFGILQKIRSGNRSKISKINDGTSIIEGRVSGTKKLITPISQKRCIYWELEITYVSYGRIPKIINLYKGSLLPSFYLKDGDERIRIWPYASRIWIKKYKKYNGSLSGKGIFGLRAKKLPDSAYTFVQKLDKKEKEQILDQVDTDLEVSEYYIEENDSVCIVGQLGKYYDEKCILNKEFLWIFAGGKEEGIHNLKERIKIEFVVGITVILICLSILINIYIL